MSERIHLGISTCPNDTFLFHAVLEGRVDTGGLDLHVELRDVQELNERLLAGEFDVAKGSFHAALLASDRLGVLPAGSALGFGNGPLLVAREPGGVPGPDSRVVCPGEHTTATLLYRFFHPGGATPRQVVFSEVFPRLEAGEADFGVCIHEGRFTYAARGLALVEDLGARWERATGVPLPLGGLLARRELGTGVLRRIQALVRASLAYARAHPAETLPTLRRHAQELADDVLLAHVELYVNDWTADLGPEGLRALAELSARAAAVGVAAGERPPLEVVGRERIFHVAPRGTWDAEAGEDWCPPPLAGEGLVHLSLAHQLAGTLDAHFADPGELVLVEVDPEAVARRMRFEPSRGGELFPHLHGPLPRSAVLRRWDLGARPDARSVPWLGAVADEDAPRGRRS